jgi:hypothetical protein
VNSKASKTTKFIITTTKVSQQHNSTDVATPSLEHLGKTAGCQLQRALSHVLMEFAYDCFNANPHIDSRAKIANAACAAICAGAWMEVLPVEPELTMSDEAYDAAFCHRFLLPNDRLVHGGLTRSELVSRLSKPRLRLTFGKSPLRRGYQWTSTPSTTNCTSCSTHR